MSQCDYCGDAIRVADWHPATIATGDEPRLLTFCEPACRDRWHRQELIEPHNT